MNVLESVQAVFLDIDGVIIGSVQGENTPMPHVDVLHKLRDVHKSGIRVCLCTARASFCVADIVKAAELDGFHIADNGALILNPITGQFAEKHVIPSDDVSKILGTLIENSIYTWVSTPSEYFVQADKLCSMTEQCAEFLNSSPQITENLAVTAKGKDVVGITIAANDLDDRKRVEKILETMDLDLTVTWTKNPSMPCAEFAVLSPNGVSKQGAAVALAQKIGVSFDNILGVGDTEGDWSFVQLCKFGAAVGNASDKLKQLVGSKGEHGFIGGSVDENGIIGILDHFLGRGLK